MDKVLSNPLVYGVPPSPKADADALINQELKATSPLRQFCRWGTLDSGNTVESYDVARKATHITKIIINGYFENIANTIKVRSRNKDGSTRDLIISLVSPDIFDNHTIGSDFTTGYWNFDFNPPFVIQQNSKDSQLLDTYSIACTSATGNDSVDFSIFGYDEFD